MSKLFVNLHCHSQFSIGDSIARCEDIARQAKELGMDSISITDHGTLAGWLMFKDACTKYSIKPIFGMEAYFVDDRKAIADAGFEINETLLKSTEIKKNANK